MSDDYRDLVELLAINKIDATIDNGHIDHAEALFEAILKHSKNFIKIYSGKLENDFYSRGNLTNLFNDFLTKNSNARVQILVEEDPSCSPQHPLISNLSAFESRFELYCVPSSMKINKGKHFLVGDGISYREEEAHPATSRTDYKAKANFNSIVKAGELMNLFDEAINSIKRESGPISA